MGEPNSVKLALGRIERGLMDLQADLGTVRGEMGEDKPEYWDEMVGTIDESVKRIIAMAQYWLGERRR